MGRQILAEMKILQVLALKNLGFIVVFLMQAKPEPVESYSLVNVFLDSVFPTSAKTGFTESRIMKLV